jgi:hypothetical protein
MHESVISSASVILVSGIQIVILVELSTSYPWVDYLSFVDLDMSVNLVLDDGLLWAVVATGSNF